MSRVRRLLAARDVDLGEVLDEMRFLTTEKLGPNRALTPEGFLLVQDTPVARAGWQIYAPQEIPGAERFTPPPDGVFRVWRDEKEVFDALAMASGNGKPIVDEHPEQIVTPDTHAGAPGVAMNPHRGEGIDDDLLLMDLMVYSKDLIAAIGDGKREISLGYDVDYEEMEPGKLAQKNIRINHVALVDSGRCGPRCSIGDHSPTAEEVSMAMTKRKNGATAFDRIRALLMKSTAIPAADKEELEKALKEGEAEDVEGQPGDTPHHVEIHNHMPAAASETVDDPDPDGGAGDLEARVSRLETAIHELAEMVRGGGTTSDVPEELETRMKGLEDAFKKMNGEEEITDEEGKAILGQLELEAPPGAEAVDVKAAKDSRYLADSYKATVAMAEIVAPGIRVPTFDQKSPPARSFKSICDLRRSALDLAWGKADTRGMIEEVLAGRALDVKKMSCDAVRSAFNAVAVMKKNRNNAQIRVGDGAGENRTMGEPVGGVKSLADLQKVFNTHYAGK